jgi:hypothetical protein
MAITHQITASNSSLIKMERHLNWRLLVALCGNMAFWAVLISSFSHSHSVNAQPTAQTAAEMLSTARG